jgi:hypothetical protein
VPPGNRGRRVRALAADIFFETRVVTLKLRSNYYNRTRLDKSFSRLRASPDARMIAKLTAPGKSINHSVRETDTSALSGGALFGGET